MWRNLGLALACVFAITFVLLAETKICLMVFTCVALTLVDVVGALNFWKTTLDPLSSVNIILAVGLCIDYPAHIAHSFLVAAGNHNIEIVSIHYLLKIIILHKNNNEIFSDVKSKFIYRIKCTKSTM